MSFGDGNLRERVGDLNRQVDKLQRTNGELCAEINRQERRIRELEALVRYMEPWIVGAARKLVIKHMDALGIEVEQ